MEGDDSVRTLQIRLRSLEAQLQADQIIEFCDGFCDSGSRSQAIGHGVST